MQKGRKPSLQHIHIWRYPTHVLKPKIDMLEVRYEVYWFVGYPKGTRRHYFYNQVDQKVFVSTNARFLEEDYMVSNRVRHDINWKALEDTPILEHEIMSLEVPKLTIPISSSTPVSYRSGRIVV